MEIKTTLDGREIKAMAEWINGVLWIHYEGRTWSVDSNETARRKKRGGGGASNPLQIDSPMPGKITKILKQKSDSVQRGDAVVVVEAMKMEYTLKAEGDGIVDEVHCAVGDQVGLGQKLVSLQAVKS